MKILDHKIGDYLYEKSIGDEPTTVGKIVSISESKNKKDTVFVLLVSDKNEYTIYSCLNNCQCMPRVARFIPKDNLLELMSRIDDVHVVEKEKSSVNVNDEIENKMTTQSKCDVNQDQPKKTKKITQQQKIAEKDVKKEKDTVIVSENKIDKKEKVNTEKVNKESSPINDDIFSMVLGGLK